MLTTIEETRRPAKDIGTTVAFAGNFLQAHVNMARVAGLVAWMAPRLMIGGGGNNILTPGSGLTLAEQYAQTFEVWKEMIDDGLMISAASPDDFSQDDGSAFLAHFNQSSLFFAHTLSDVTFFVLNAGLNQASEVIELAGNDSSSDQFLWLRDQVSACKSYWKIVVVGQPLYTSAAGKTAVEALRWPFKDLGIDLVLSGLPGSYERLSVDGLPIINCGTGGWFALPSVSVPADPNSQKFIEDFGALKLDFYDTDIRLRFYNDHRVKLDEFLIHKPYR